MRFTWTSKSSKEVFDDIIIGCDWFDDELKVINKAICKRENINMSD